MLQPLIEPRSARAGARRRLAVPACLAALLLAAPGTAGAQDGPEQAKAELLVQIARFIEWPGSAFRGAGKHFTFAILGEDSLAGVLASTMSTRSINGRKVYVRCVRRPEDARGCHILFIASSEQQRVPEVLAALAGASVLTVADLAGFARQGGMVDFLLDQERVRFSINLASAEKARLKISARLLALATIVDDGS